MSRLTKWVSLAVLLLSLVGVVLWQVLLAQQINFYIISAVIMLVSMLPFFISLEAKSITSREITMLATLIALAVVSRVAFYLVPQVKPIVAVVIASAVCFGAERGFLIGAFSAFVSNFIFGQGLWTPFQMVALGTVGLIAGLLFRVVKPTRIKLAIAGFVLAFVVYGAIADLSTIFVMYGSNITLSAVISVYGAGMGFSLVLGISTAVFLFIFGEPLIKKVERINKKYNLIN